MKKSSLNKVSQLLGIPVPCPRWQEFFVEGSSSPNEWRSIYKKQYYLVIVTIHYPGFKSYRWRVKRQKEILETGEHVTPEFAKLAIRECLRRHL